MGWSWLVWGWAVPLPMCSSGGVMWLSKGQWDMRRDCCGLSVRFVLILLRSFAEGAFSLLLEENETVALGGCWQWPFMGNNLGPWWYLELDGSVSPRANTDSRLPFKSSNTFSWRRKWQPTPVFLPENSMDRGVWRVHGTSRSQTQVSD